MLDRVVGGLQQALGQAQPLALEPLAQRKNPVCVRMRRSPAAATRNSYHGSAMSLRSSPNTYLWNGVEELDFAGPYEVLTSWARASERPITVRTVADTADAVRCSHGLQVVPDIGWDELGKVDLFVMPGGRSGPLTEDAAFLARVSGLAHKGALMASVCTGAHVFARPACSTAAGRRRTGAR